MTAPGRPRGPAPGSGTTLLVIAKEPVPGRVKTRLVPPCTPRQAAALAEAALADTLHAVLAAPAGGAAPARPRTGASPRARAANRLRGA